MDEVRKRIEESKNKLRDGSNKLKDKVDDVVKDHGSDNSNAAKGTIGSTRDGLRDQIRKSREFTQDSVNSMNNKYQCSKNYAIEKKNRFISNSQWISNGYRKIRSDYPLAGILGSTAVIGLLSYPFGRYRMYRNLFITGTISTAIFSPSTLPYLFNLGRGSSGGSSEGSSEGSGKH